MEKINDFTSRSFRAISIFYLVYPLAFLVIANTALGITADGIVAILLSPLYYFIATVTVIGAIGIRSLQRWGWYFFCFSNFLLIYQIAQLSTAAPGIELNNLRVETFLTVSGVLILFFLRIRKEMRVPYLLPKIRWWELGSPSMFSVDATLYGSAQGKGMGEILDLSSAGCFIKTQTDFPLFSSIDVQFNVDGKEIRCPGSVIWKARSSVTHPKGIGVKFSGVDRAAKKQIKSLIHASASARTSCLSL